MTASLTELYQHSPYILTHYICSELPQALQPVMPLLFEETSQFCKQKQRNFSVKSKMTYHGVYDPYAVCMGLEHAIKKPIKIILACKQNEKSQVL